MQYKIINSDCVAAMRAMPDSSVDSIVTDPPYELGFMGKGWDSTGVANSVEMWTEALRVLKPGGHLLAFSGSRTYHRMTCAIEDAGFEIRDQIMWVYGSGFPKSLDVSKAIDKQDATDMRRARQLRFTEWVRGTGLTSARIDELTGTNMGGHYTTAASQPAVATREHLEKLRPFIEQPVPAWVEALVDERTVESLNYKQREVVGTREKLESWDYKGNNVFQTGGDAERVTIIETSAHTPEARQWEGWGTALKPAHEPICVARKPLIGTVAANVLVHGTGVLNIDGCRVATSDSNFFRPAVHSGEHEGWDRPWKHTEDGEARRQFSKDNAAVKAESLGRWPANIIHDGSPEVVALFPAQAGAAAAVRGDEPSSASTGQVTGKRARVSGAFHGDTGSAARFFYCAKASKSDRGADNTHPTVKPTGLMAYLVRLVTPPGGLVLDPFMGSGSTGKAAVREGFRFIGCELSPEYVAIATARIEHELFGDLI